MADRADASKAEPGIVAVSNPVVNEAGDTAVITATPSTSPSAEATESLVRRVRDDVLPGIEATTGAEVFLTGSTAANIDISDKLGSALPLFMVLVIGLTILLLMVVFRSILVPIKAAIAILISIASAFGVIVAIFQWGWLKGLGIEETSPMLTGISSSARVITAAALIMVSVFAAFVLGDNPVIKTFAGSACRQRCCSTRRWCGWSSSLR